ncbi:MAG: ATP-binding protein, partial [Parasporobacterium sp.]|nr:ATP-binding protein [Parasporobacterium sp.]
YIISSDNSILDGCTSSRPVERLDILPLGFSEYCEACGDDTDTGSLFESYIETGGIPGFMCMEDFYPEEDQKTLYSEIKKNLIFNYKIQDQRLFSTLLSYLMDNIGAVRSPNKISSEIKESGLSANHVTIGKYIRYILSSNFFRVTKRYDLKTDKILETADRYYILDTGLLKNRKHIYENLVYFELIRRGYTVYSGKLYQKEIDFVAKKDGNVLYIQCCECDGDNLIDEIARTLLSVKDAYPKMIIAATGKEDYMYKGIRIIDIAGWLKAAEY